MYSEAIIKILEGDDMNSALLIKVLELILTHGIPVTIAAIKATGKEELTLEDIQELRTRIKPPEDY